MQANDNKAIVRRYFEALDAGDAGMAKVLFSDDCRIYRPEQSDPLVGTEVVQFIISAAHVIYSEFQTTIRDMIQEGDKVAVRLQHRAVYRDKFTTRVGTFDLTGKSTRWDAMAIFTLRSGKVEEEYVMRDELGMLLDAGAIQPSH